MKFIDVNKAKVSFNEPVAVKLKDGSFGHARLVERKETSDGTHHAFELAVFANDQSDPLISFDVTHVARYPKGKEEMVTDPETL
jgi:hypothetical protein